MIQWLAIGILGVLVLALALSQLAIFTHFGRMYVASREGQADQGPRLGSKAPAIQAKSATGQVAMLPLLHQPTILMFASLTCKACERLKPFLGRVASDHPRVAILVVCRGPADAVADWAADVSDCVSVYPDSGGQLAAKYEVGITPIFVGVDELGTVVGKGVYNDPEQVASLCELVSRTGPRSAERQEVRIP